MCPPKYNKHPAKLLSSFGVSCLFQHQTILALNQKCLRLLDLNLIKFVSTESRVAKYERPAPPSRTAGRICSTRQKAGTII